MIIGLTGGIASGKTTVSKILKQMGIKVISADDIAHKKIKKGEKGWRRVIDEFGEEILQDDGEIDRKKLGKIVFNNQQQRKKLEQLTHPLIITEIKEKINKHNKSEEHLVIEAPLLYETGLEDNMDQIWVVYVDRKTQIERLMKRNNFTQKEAEQRIDSQLSLEQKKQKADIVIDNRGRKEDLKNKVKKFWEKEVKN